MTCPRLCPSSLRRLAGRRGSEARSIRIRCGATWRVARHPHSHRHARRPSLLTVGSALGFGRVFLREKSQGVPLARASTAGILIAHTSAAQFLRFGGRDSMCVHCERSLGACLPLVDPHRLGVWTTNLRSGGHARRADCGATRGRSASSACAALVDAEAMHG